MTEPWLFVGTEHSEAYSKFRLQHPPSLFRLFNDTLLSSTASLSPALQKEHGQNSQGRWKTALDIGCGTGLSTLPLIDFVQESFGVDHSASQIHQAKLGYGNRDPSRVTFLQAELEQLEGLFAANHFDLVTVAAAAHWMPRNILLSTAYKLLRPGGLMAVYTLGAHSILNNHVGPLFDELLKEFFFSRIAPEALKALKGCHEIMEEMKKYFPVVEREERIILKKELNVDELRGLLSTYSPYQKFVCLERETEADALEEFTERTRRIVGEELLTLTISYPVLLACKPLD